MTKKFITDAAKAYKGVAELKIKDGFLVLGELRGDGFRPFVDGRYSIPLSKKEIEKVKEWLPKRKHSTGYSAST